MRLAESLALWRVLGDPTRVRLLAALEKDELTVAELQQALELPQSRVSTHLARLKEAGLALDRTDGPHRYYRIADGAMPPATQAAWAALRQPLDGDVQLERDRRRLETVLAARTTGTWVDRVAGSLERHYSPGRTWEALARGLSLLTDLGVVADFGAGDGTIAELLAPRALRIIGIDSSAKMVEAGRQRLGRAGLNHVELVRGDMQQVPLAQRSVDFVLVQQSLQYAEQPAQVFHEAARILRPKGRLLVITLLSHRHDEVRATYGHLHLGFTAAQLRRWTRAAGLELVELVSAGRERRPPQFEALALLGRHPAGG